MLTKSSDTLQYLIDAVSGSAKINIPAIAAGHFPKDNTQTAVYFKGKSSVVFAFQLQKKLKAIKIWPAPVSEFLRNHYRIVENYIQRGDLNYFGGICYLKDAVTIKDQQHDALLMDWIGRQNIKEYIIANIDQKELLDTLAEKICCLHRDLNNAGIAHGHLHTGNIYIDSNNELRLIDYDSIYIKGITEEREMLQNYPDYCHPYFSTHQKINARADYFSALLLYLGTKAIAYNTVLWGRYKVGFQENFLFTAADFQDLKNSSVYKYIRKIGSAEIDELLEILLMYCEEKDPDNLQPFYTYLKNDPLPVANPISAIETTAEINAEKNKPVTTKPLVFVTMPAQVVITETEKTEPVIEELPAGQINPSENSLTQDTIQERLENEPALLSNNNNQKKEEKNISLTIADLPVNNPVKKIATSKKNTGNRGATMHRVAKKHKSIFLMAASFIVAAAFTAIYFWGNYANKTDSVTNLPPAKTVTQQPVEPIINTTAETGKDTGNNILIIDSPAVNTASDTKSTNSVKEDSVAAKTAVQVVDNLAKIHVTNNNHLSADTAATIAGTQLLENDSTVSNEQNLKNPVRKPAVVKNNSIKKQSSNTFEIGTVPKQ